MRRSLIHAPSLAVAIIASLACGASAADEVLCYTERITGVPSFDIYTGRHDPNNPILWTHTVPPGILDSVVRVGLFIEAYDVDYPANDEHDRVSWNGHDLGLLEGLNNEWGTVEKTVPPEFIIEGLNQLRVDVDELDHGWKVTIRASEIRFYCSTATPDFSIGAIPESSAVTAGDSTEYTVSLTALNRFNSPVTLAVSGLPVATTAELAPNPVTPTAESTLTVETSEQTPPGEYKLAITGTSGDLSHSTEVTLIVMPAPDFTLTAEPESQKAPQGATVQYDVELDALNGFESPVDLSVRGLPPGANAAFAKTPATPPATTKLEIATSTETPVGVYTLSITGKGGGRTHTAGVTIDVTPEPDFEISVSPPSQTIMRTGKASYTVTIASIGGFALPVDLAAGGLPAGATLAFSINPVTAPGESVLTITTGTETPVGTFTITVSAAGGNKQHSATATLVITAEPDFSLTVTPASRELVPGLPAVYDISLAPLNGFDSTVELSVAGLPEGAESELTRKRVTPPGKSTLSVAAAVPPAAGTYILTVGGAGGGKSHAIPVELIVPEDACPGFTVVAVAQPASGPAPLEVRFKAVITEDAPYAGEYRHAWDFGDGQTSTEAAPSHSFEDPGTYNVTVRVTNVCDAAQEASVVVDAGAFRATIGKSFEPAQALPGDEIKMRIDLKNETGMAFSDVSVWDELSPHLEYLSDTAPVKPVWKGRRIEWTFPVFQKKQRVAFDVTLRVSEKAPAGKIVNTAFIDHESLRSPIASNRATLEVSRIKAMIRKSVDRTEAGPGDKIVYRIEVTNRSKVALTGVEVEDELSPYLDFLSQESDLAFSQSGGKLLWKGAIEEGKEAAIEVHATIKQTTSSGVQIVNKSSLAAKEIDQRLGSNAVATVVRTEPIPATQVVFRKEAEIPQADVGHIVRFRLTVENRSSSVLLAPRVEDSLPQGFAYVAGSSLLNDRHFADPDGTRTIIWSLPAVAPHQTMTLRFQIVIGTDARRGKNVNRAVLRTTDTSGQTIVLQAEDFVNVSASSFTFYSGVEGTVFLDRDEDELLTASDTPLDGIEVRMSSGQQSYTDTAGRYSFEGLFPGDYAVGVNRATLPEKYTLSDPLPRVVVLMDGLTETVDFPVRLSGDDTESARREGGGLFVVNQNQAWDDGEPLAAEFRAALDGTIVTGGRDGVFVLTHLEPGAHTLEISYESGSRALTREIQLGKGENKIDIPLRFTGIRVVIDTDRNRP